MKIIVSPDSFKGSCSAIEVADSIEKAIHEVDSTINVVKMPVMRPLIAMDKIDIMDKAQEIGTFETSIQPYEDCCTVFLPKHPTTKPKLERILEAESVLDIEGLVEAAVKAKEVINIFPE